MPLPNTRERTYGALSQIFSADLNAIQDAIVSIFTGLQTGSFTPILQNSGVDHATYTAQQGRFVAIGDFVFFQLRLVATSLDPAGVLRIRASSLPFAPSSASVTTQGCVCAEFSGGAGG